jgi:hypothetical protein
MSLGNSLFFVLLAIAPEQDSLETLSGMQIDDDRTPMIRRAVEAWKTPLDRLTCDQVRLLVSQKMGLEWLAQPVTAFVHLHPDACATFFPGDLALAALRAMPELLAIDPQGARAMATLDFSWLTEDADNDPEFTADIVKTIEGARLLARGHS